MAPVASIVTPGLTSFLRSVSTESVEKSIEYFIALVKRRQIRGSKPCAIATAYLLRRTISLTRASEHGRLISRVTEVGRRLINAAPRELAIGNIVRRVLGLIRDEEDESKGLGGDISSMSSELGSEPATPRIEIPNLNLGSSSPMDSSDRYRDQNSGSPARRNPLVSTQTGTNPMSRPLTSMFSMISHPTMRTFGIDSPTQRSGAATPQMGNSTMISDIRAEILEGISEIIEELDQADDQIANYALEHIHPQETILTYSSSLTVQRFLIKAASKRKFTVVHAEAYPNNHHKTHSIITGNHENSEDQSLNADSFQKPLISSGISVVMIPDSAIFALMSRVSKVVLGAHAVLSNGSFVAAAGSKSIVKAARFHRVPVIVLAATYKLSPQYPYDPYELIEYGDVAKVVPYQDVEMRDGLQGGVRNPIHDFVEGTDVDLYITNLGGVSSGYLYRVIKDQYRDEDVDFEK